MNTDQIEYINLRIKEAQHMLGYNGGYNETSKILSELSEMIESILVQAGKARRVLRVN
jgi:hypothetical protein